MFVLHWCYLDGEVGIDSTAGWVAVVDGLSNYAMVERMNFSLQAQYPERSSVIFYINGPQLRLDQDGMPQITSSDALKTPYYMEAELNSPLVSLKPGETYAFDTDWFPTRATPSLSEATEAGVVNQLLTAAKETTGVRLAGSWGAFYPGRLLARFYSSSGLPVGNLTVTNVSPLEIISLNQIVKAPLGSGRVSLHLIDDRGVDRGSLGEVRISGAAASPW
jgi:hypothetical protein